MRAAQLRLLELTSLIVKAYLTRVPVSPVQLPELMRSITEALGGLGTVPEQLDNPKRMPPVELRKTITPTHIISLEDGKPYQTLKRHLATKGLTPEQYREKWGLPPDYPMIAKAYSARRSANAKRTGLGRR